MSDAGAAGSRGQSPGYCPRAAGAGPAAGRTQPGSRLPRLQNRGIPQVCSCPCRLAPGCGPPVTRPRLSSERKTSSLSAGALGNANSKVALFFHVPDGPGAASQPPTGAPRAPQGCPPPQEGPPTGCASFCTAPRSQRVHLRDTRPGRCISHAELGQSFQAVGRGRQR